MARQGLVLFAHGARDPRWAAPFDAIAERVRAAQPALAVRLAFLELMTPSLLDAAAELVHEGCNPVDVLPLFLGAGGHVRRDLPELIERLSIEHPAVQFRLHPPIGETPQAIEALSRVAVQMLDSGAP